MEEAMGLFSNFWWATVANDYSVSIFLGATLIITILKIWAVMNPGTKTNSILCLIQGWFYGVPGYKKTEETISETKTSKTSESTTSLVEEGKDKLV